MNKYVCLYLARLCTRCEKYKKSISRDVGNIKLCATTIMCKNYRIKSHWGWENAHDKESETGRQGKHYNNSSSLLMNSSCDYSVECIQVLSQWRTHYESRAESFVSLSPLNKNFQWSSSRDIRRGSLYLKFVSFLTRSVLSLESYDHCKFQVTFYHKETVTRPRRTRDTLWIHHIKKDTDGHGGLSQLIKFQLCQLLSCPLLLGCLEWWGPYSSNIMI